MSPQVHYDAVPDELRDRPQWLVWRYEWRDGESKPTKVPYRATSPTAKASSTDPATWVDYASACRVATAEGFDGIGFVVTAGDPICGVDLDGCVSGGVIHEGARALVRELESYTELSPSGAGLRVFLLGNVPGERRKTATTPWGDAFEVYGSARYLTVTGRHLPDTPTTVEGRQAQLDTVCAAMFPQKATATQRPLAGRIATSDGELIDRMFSAANGASVRALWNGDTKGHNDDESAADLALCNALVFWTGGDCDRVDELFRQSGLMRPKWDQRRGEQTYGALTITKALGTANALPGRKKTQVSDFAPAPVERGAAPSDSDGLQADPVFTHPRIINMTAAMEAASGPLPYRVRPFALDATVTLLVGRAGESKTFLGLCACAGVQSGADLGPLTCERGRALYLDGENGERQMARRFKLLGFDPEALTVADGTGLRLPRDIGEVRDLVTGTGASLLIVDSLRRLAPDVREDKSDDVGPLMAAFAQLARETGCAVVVIHHRSTKDNAANVRGSSTLEDQADVVFALEKCKGDPERATRRRLRCVKMRPDSEPPATWVQFKTVAGVMAMTAAAPFEAGDKPSAHETVANEIRRLADQTPDDGWKPGELAEAVGRERKDNTFQAALRSLLDTSEWTESGSTRDRRLCPSDSSQSSIHVGGTNESDESENLMLKGRC